MDITLLFRKKSPLTEEGLPWLRGAFEHEFTARRNTSGRAVPSAVLVRSLLAWTARCSTPKPALAATSSPACAPALHLPVM